MNGGYHLVYFARIMPAVELTAGEDLRYSVRSAVANLGVDQLHIFGGAPRWAGPTVRLHRVPQGGTKHQNTWRVWLRIADACRHKELPDQFLLMMDDVFCMERVDQIPVMTLGTMDAWIAQRGTGISAKLADPMRHTVEVLNQRDPLGPRMSFEAHVPLVVERDQFAEIVPSLDAFVSRRGRIAKRSAYGNLAEHRAPIVNLEADVKVRNITDPIPTGPWLSTSDAVWSHRRGSAGKLIRDAFREPCPFEA